MKTISMVKKFLNFLFIVGEKLQPLFLLAIRLFWGFLFFQAGRAKLEKMDATIEFFKSLHIPFPEFSSYLVAYFEAVGGLLLMVGFATRLISLPLMIIMFTALWTTQYETIKNIFYNPEVLLKASPFIFLIFLITVFVFGPGKYSLDRIMAMATNSDSKGKR